MAIRLAAAMVLLSAALPLQAADAPAVCAKAGTVEKWDSGEGFTVLPRSGSRQYAMRLTGSAFRPDYASPRMAMQIDGIHYQFVFVPLTDFAGLVRRGDETLLDLHAKWEFDAAQKSPTPLTRFHRVGVNRRVADAEAGVHEATFLLWRMHDPANTASQFYVTTVVGEEVVVMSAIVRPDRAEVFRDVMRHYADTLVWFDCPA